MNRIFFITAAAVFMAACGSQNKPAMNRDMNKYANEWEKIEQFREQGLPQSMQSGVDSIYQAASEEKNYGQLIKALIFRINGIGLTMENDEGANLIFDTLKREAEALPQPAKSVVYSIIGQMYEDYYDRNVWRINRRTNAADDPDDIHTWDTRRLTEETVKYYDLSLQDIKTLQNEPVGNYNDILLEGYDPVYQPSLYDVLAKRALACFASTFNVYSLPQQVFVVNDPRYFAGAREFTATDIQSADSLSPPYLSLKIYRELLRFHLEKSGYAASADNANEDVAALIDVDLRRLSFLKEQGRYADNERMYEEALTRMSRDYKAYDHNARVLLQLAGFYSERGEAWRDDRQEENKPGYAKAFRLCERIENEYPGRWEDRVNALKETIVKKEMNLRVEETQLPGKPFLALLKFRNIDVLHQVTYRLSEQEAIAYHYSRKDIPGFVEALEREPVRKRIELPGQEDFQYCTAEIKIDPLEKGFYLVLWSGSEDPPSSSGDIRTSAFIQVSSLMAYDRKIDGITTVAVTERESGKPVPGAEVTAYRGVNVRTSCVSDKNGIATGLKEKENDDYCTIVHGDERLLLFRLSYDRKHYPETAGDHAVLFTDRAIYRPGQMVYFKAILLHHAADGGRTVQSGKDVNVRFLDVNRKVIAEKKLTSNDFGSVNGSFTIPQGLLNGNMRIECSGSGSVSIRVEEYKRPAFEVKFHPVKGNFALNERVTVTANAKALAGYAVNNAGVRYRVVRSMRYRYYGWHPPFGGENREIASGVLKTDGKGDFSVEFDALADDIRDDRKIYTYTVTADVTDVNGETRSAAVDVYIGNKPLLVTADLPDELASGKPDGYAVRTTNLNGEFTPASVTVEIISLKQPPGLLRNRIWRGEKIDVYTIPEDEFRREFPLDAYGDELNPENFKETGTVARYVIETAERTKLDLSALKQPGFYRIKLTADNRKGVVVDHIHHVCLLDDRAGEIGNMDKWLRTVKAAGEPGGNVEFLVAGGHVYCEIIHENRIVKAWWITAGATPVSVTCPVRKEYSGGFAVQFCMIRDNRKYSAVVPVTVPFTNKMLDVKLATFRDKLLPGENETWTVKVSDKKGKSEMAEVVASLYDASLDEFVPHRWPDVSGIYYRHVNTSLFRWNLNAIECYARSETVYGAPPVSPAKPEVFLTDINWYDRTYRNAFAGPGASGEIRIRGLALVEEDAAAVYRLAEPSPEALNEAIVVGFGSMRKEAAPAGEPAAPPANALAGASQQPGGGTADAFAGVATRTNFNETAFFYPALRTNERGETLIEFTMPEALTRWKLLSFAHTKDLKAGSYTNELITQKQVAVSANPPRFFRENDTIEFTAKVNNLTLQDLDGRTLLRLYDALTMQPADAILRSEQAPRFTVKAGGSAALVWKLAIPEGIRAITYRLTAQAGTHTDGEEKTLPVLTNSMLVTETLPFSIRAGREKEFSFDKLVNGNSPTLRNHSLTLEFTSAPAWYAVQSLPYIMEYPYECAEQTFSRYYANALATAIIDRTPRIKQIFDLWKTFGSEALASNLEKNRELKQVVLEETPWLMQADSETERRKRIALLFDLNRMRDEMNRTFNKLKDAQNPDGGFPWFDGLPSDRYITQHIVTGLAHLAKLDAIYGTPVAVPPQNGHEAPAPHVAAAGQIVQRALSFLDRKIADDYKKLPGRETDMDKRHITAIHLHYLYACSFSGHRPAGGDQREAFDFYLAQAGRFWKEFSTHDKALAALVLHRNGRTENAQAIVRSLGEYAQQSEELGMYWKDNVAGRFWHQAPVETQALLIETFHEVAPADSSAVEEMKIWLLRNRQANDWKTTKATAGAIYALLATGGGNLPDESKTPDIEIARKPLAAVARDDIRPEPGTGYVKTSWHAAAITPQMGLLKVKNPNRKGIAWGSLYWQYFEQIDRITTAETDLKMNRQLFLRTLTGKGETLQPINEGNRLHVGDLVRVRMELRAGRDYEYVHLKDMHASGFEPVSVLSGNRYRDGLWYYESIRDVSVNFFIHSLPKGVYVFEYDLRVSHAGDFSNGITAIQCMYAPEYSSHSEGLRITVD
ncbi:MAG: hypothetical protein LBS79_05545 [Tannerella sp.]|jgi:hypothetical protein|nr:hypothetical protein [Tannerella sp.]